MLTFAQFIAENLDIDLLNEAKTVRKDDPNTVGQVTNNTKGTLHEILTGMYLNGGKKHMEQHKNQYGQSPEQSHEKLKEQIHPDDYERIRARAESAANHIRATLEASHPGHEIQKVTHTSKNGDTEKVTGVPASQKTDSSDIYITTKHPKTGELIHHGISLKVTDKSSKNVPSSSLGSKSGGTQAATLLAAHRKKIKELHPELSSMSNETARKEWAEKNPEKHDSIKVENRSLLKSVAAAHATELQDKLKNGSHQEVMDHIRGVIHAEQTPAEAAGRATFQKVTSYQTSKGTQHNTSRPADDYDHILNDHKNITVKHDAGGSVHFYHNGKKFASQSHKFDSQSDPLSPLKSAGRTI